ncbi:MAG: DnaJ domain-containing protein [Deltaproteobacteria bacterium]|jgi:molecular chaperone DnaJ|nr:DnaJ domain-containing protein [Deltaproteobacteria bacterium]
MLTRQECFKILRLENSAGPNAIKQSYRKLAFALHPDLNPDLPEAPKKFQQLNEAYVLLMQEYAHTSYGARSGRAEASAGSPPPPRPEDGAAAAGGAAAASRAYRKAGRDFSARESSAGADRSVSYGSRSLRREDLLRELLTDPFARRVFDDIYSQLGRNGGKAASPAPRPHPPRKSRKLEVKPAASPLLIQACGKAISLLAGVKGWLRRKIDDEQVVFLPAEALFPGMRVRLQIRHGFSERSRTVEFSLPPEFRPGLPIRLKGLGMKLGSLRGDLYLRVFEQEEEEGV